VNRGEIYDFCMKLERVGFAATVELGKKKPLIEIYTAPFLKPIKKQ